MIHLAPHTTHDTGRAASPAVISALALIGLSQAGCADLYSRSSDPEIAGDVSEANRAALSGAVVYVYPSAGQSAAQLDRDRYECYVWAVGQTGFDPSNALLAPHQRVAVVAGPSPGSDAAAGAVSGAIIGAATARRGHALEGAIVGTVIGGLLGSASDAARAEELDALRRQRSSEELAHLERQSSEYRRALAACLEGRRYTVK